MVDLLLLNDGTKCTLLETFEGKAVVLIDGKRLEFKNLNEAKHFVAESKIEVNCCHLHGCNLKRWEMEGSQND